MGSSADQGMCTPSLPDVLNKMIHSASLNLTPTWLRDNVHYFQIKIGMVQQEALLNNEIRLEIKTKYV